MHVVAGKAVAFREAMLPDFKAYVAAIVANAKALADELMAKGWRLVSGGTDNHLMLVDLRSRKPDLTGHDAAIWLSKAGIIVNKNGIPFDPRPPIKTSGIRIGSPALTTRGMGISQMKTVAGWIDEILSSDGNEAVIKKVSSAVLELGRQFPIPNVNGQ